MDRFNATCARTSGTRPHPCTLLADFFHTEKQAAVFSERLSLTKDERNLLCFLVKSRENHLRGEIPAIFQQVEDLNSLKMYERRIIGDQWPPGKSIKIRDQVRIIAENFGSLTFALVLLSWIILVSFMNKEY